MLVCVCIIIEQLRPLKIFTTSWNFLDEVTVLPPHPDVLKSITYFTIIKHTNMVTLAVVRLGVNYILSIPIPSQKYQFHIEIKEYEKNNHRDTLYTKHFYFRSALFLHIMVHNGKQI